MNIPEFYCDNCAKLKNGNYYIFNENLYIYRLCEFCMNQKIEILPEKNLKSLAVYKSLEEQISELDDEDKYNCGCCKCCACDCNEEIK